MACPPPAVVTANTTLPRSLTTLNQAAQEFLQEVVARGRGPKTLEWHRTSLGALQEYLWSEFHLLDIRLLRETHIRTWLAVLRTTPSAVTGAALAVNTIAAYARSARAFCHWLVQQEYVPRTPFPHGVVPKADPRPLHLIEPEEFERLLRACQPPEDQGGQRDGTTARNRAILWLLLDTGLLVSELCRLRLSDVDRARGTVTVPGAEAKARHLPLSEDGQLALLTYLEQYRLTPAWSPVLPDAQESLFLTEQRRPLTKNSLTLLFLRLSQRAEFSRTPICPSMLRDTYAIRFLQAGGELAALQEQLGVAGLVSVKRYQRFCEQRRPGRGFSPSQ